MADRFDLIALEDLPLLQRRQRRLLIVQRRFRIVDAFNVGPEETGEVDVPAGRAKLRVFRGNRHRLKLQPRFGHLRGDGPFPDQGIEVFLAALEIQFVRGFHIGACGTNRFVGFLRVFRFRRVLPGGLAEVLVSVPFLHAAAGRADGFAGKMHAVGPHVGDDSLFVQPLCDLHRLPGRQSQFAVRFLLQRAGGEGCVGPAFLLSP